MDEHEPVRGALAERFARAQQISILGHSGEVGRVMSDAANDHPDVVLLEIKSTAGIGLELLRQLTHLPEPPQVIVLTSCPTEWEKEAARRAGAAAYLLKEIDSDEQIRYIADIVGQRSGLSSQVLSLQEVVQPDATVIRYYRRRLNCVTGDMLGALTEVTEAGLVLVASLGGSR